MKTAVIVVVLIAVLAGGGFFAYRSMTSRTPSQPAVTETATVTTQTPQASPTITYDSSGFSPATITVGVGEAVTFVNQSSRAMWIASNPHPIHTGLAGFDAKKGIGNGESFSFRFTKAGEFGYHNHLNLSDTGTVVVE